MYDFEIPLIKLLMQHSDFKDAQLNIQYWHTFTLYSTSQKFGIINLLKLQ